MTDQPFDLHAPRTVGQVHLNSGEVVCLPNQAIHSNDKMINNLESDSGSDDDDLDVIHDGKHLSRGKLIEAMLKFNVDVDGRPIDWNCVYKTQEQASAFNPMIVWGRPVEIPCFVLFDYHSGFTCMDVTLLGGDIAMVCAEEYETMLLGRDSDLEWKRSGMPCGFLRMQQWSLVRRCVPRQTYSSLGLVPSSWLVSEKFVNENRPLFFSNWWYLGLSSYDDAFEYLMGDVSAHEPGLFVIFSPRWLNIDPSDPRPYILLMLAPREAKTEKIMNDMGEMSTEVFQPQAENIRRKFYGMQAQLLGQFAGSEVDSVLKDDGDLLAKAQAGDGEEEVGNADNTCSTKVVDMFKEKQSKASDSTVAIHIDRARFGDKTVSVILKAQEEENGNEDSEEEVEPSVDDFVTAATSMYSWQTYTIKRSFCGDYELFGRRYGTIYHLVHDLSSRDSNLPCRLVYGKLTLPPPFKVTPMEAPLRNPKLQPHSLPMMCEQWAAKHYSQSTEPSFLSSPMSYVIRAFLDPVRNYWKKCNLPEQEVEPNRKLIAKRVLEEPKKGAKGQKLNWLVDNVPTEEHVVSFSPKIVIPKKDLEICATPLGSGNFGTIYKAKMKTERGKIDVVAKDMDILETPHETQAAFAQETDISAALCHPNIVAFFGVNVGKSAPKENDGGELETPDDPNDKNEKNEQAEPGAEGVYGKSFMVYELCSPVCLKKYLTSNTMLPMNQVIDFLSQIARGLAYLHTRVPAIAHGDVAARNVLMIPHPRDTGRFVLKVSDFGLSRFLRDDGNNKFDSDTLPFAWYPPESWNQRDLTPAADCWAYGMTITEFYGAVTPFGASDMMQSGGSRGYVHNKDKIPDPIYNLLLQCTRRAPHDRLSMAAADDYLQKHWIEAEGAYILDTYHGNRN